MDDFASAYQFPGAIFVFMAGYFVNESKAKDNYFTYLVKRGVRLLLPYVVWSSVYLLKDWVLSGNLSIRHIIYALC